MSRSQAGAHSASTLSPRGRCVGASAAQAHPTHSSKGAVPLPGQRGRAESACQVSQERRRLPGPVSKGEGCKEHGGHCHRCREVSPLSTPSPCSGPALPAAAGGLPLPPALLGSCQGQTLLHPRRDAALALPGPRQTHPSSGASATSVSWGVSCISGARSSNYQTESARNKSRLGFFQDERGNKNIGINRKIFVTSRDIRASCGLRLHLA